MLFYSVQLACYRFCARYFLISYKCCYLKCNSTLSLPSQPSRRVGPVIGVVETRRAVPVGSEPECILLLRMFNIYQTMCVLSRPQVLFYSMYIYRYINICTDTEHTIFHLYYLPKISWTIVSVWAGQEPYASTCWPPEHMPSITGCQLTADVMALANKEILT